MHAWPYACMHAFWSFNNRRTSDFSCGHASAILVLGAGGQSYLVCGVALRPAVRWGHVHDDVTRLKLNSCYLICDKQIDP